MNNKGSTLILALLIVAVLSIIGVSAATIATIDIRMSSSFKSGKEAFYIAEAGIEHAKEILRLSTQGDSFTNDLKIAAGDDNILEKNTSFSDDIPIVDSVFAMGHYSVYMMNDITEMDSLTDSNKKVMLKSIGITDYGTSSIIEATVMKLPMFPLPGTITLLGKNSSYIGNLNSEKLFSGNDSNECGSASKPVFAVSDDTTFANVKNAVDSSVPDTYKTDVEDVVQNVTDSALYDIKSRYDIDLKNVGDIKRWVSKLYKGADTIVSSGENSTEIDMGTRVDPRIVLVEGDFDFQNDGAGMLIVTGTLSFTSKIDYYGLILVIGDGVVKITGKLTVTGGIVLANINTSDDEPGSALFDASLGGNSAISLCSKSVTAAASLTPLYMVAFCNETCSATRSQQ